MDYQTGLTMTEIDLIYKPFISEPKSMVIAPAGYGKTQCIVESLNISEGHQLILTHTNAGVASLKEKIRKIGVKTSYTIETICGFAQKLVESFILKNRIPEQDSAEYFPFIINTALELFKKKAIKNVIVANYKGVFVDEYQDCTKSQHQLISIISDILPTHILGDPLQGIFDFNNEELVNFDLDLKDYICTTELVNPWRWYKSNPLLGEDLKKLREEIQNNNCVHLTDYKNIECNFCPENDLYNFRQQYNFKLRQIIGEESSLLIIHPISHNLNARTKLIKTFNNSFFLVEAMDAKDFYDLSKKIDASNSSNIYNRILEISLILFSKSKTTNWLGEQKLKNKRDFQAQITLEPLKVVFEKLHGDFQLKLVSKALKLIKELPQNKCYRTELFFDLINAIENAHLNNQSVFESMKKIRDSKRHIGKKIKGKCIGTTLLTKGLEFDTVILLNAQRFTCPKNFYVAVTRASKRLIIFSDTDEIRFS